MIFREREKFIFELVKKAQRKAEFVVIGGYAINAYTLPRFSVDCDLVVRDKKPAKAIQEFLESKGFAERSKGKILSYTGEFICLATKKPAPTTFDVLAGTIEDRITDTLFPAELIFKYSSKRTIFGKGSPIQIKTKVVDAEMLFLMKAVSARKTDIRDVFMLASTRLDKKKLLEISKQVKVPKESMEKIVSKINSKGFKDSLQGVFGMLPKEQFERTKKKLFSVLKFI